MGADLDKTGVWREAATKIVCYLLEHEGQSVTKDAILVQPFCSLDSDAVDELLSELKERSLIEIDQNGGITLA